MNIYLIIGMLVVLISPIYLIYIEHPVTKHFLRYHRGMVHVKNDVKRIYIVYLYIFLLVTMFIWPIIILLLAYYNMFLNKNK